MSPRTFRHLADLRRRPTEYEIGSSNLLYHRVRGFEVSTPVGRWYEEQQRSALDVSDWDAFRDPRQTTYASYTDLQRGKEAFVEGLVRSAEASRHDERLDATWIRVLGRILGPLRYPAHGLHMLAAYAGQAAPASTIVIACAFQAGDEMRRVQRLAYRMRELQHIEPTFGAASREDWQTGPAWQPLREMVERLLVTWDWSESLVATSFALAPRFDELFTTCLGRVARLAGDNLLEKVLFSLGEDCRWHREWSAALVRMALRDRPANAGIVHRWLTKWDPLATRAVQAFAPLLEEALAGANESFETISVSIEATCLAQRREAGLGEGG